VKGPGAVLRGLIGLVRGGAGRNDRRDAAAYEEAAREAFRGGSSLDALRPVAPPPTTLPPASPLADRPLTSVARETTGPKRRPGARRAVEAVSPATAPIAASEAVPAEEPAVSQPPTQRNRRKAGETAPDHLLRTPTGGTPVVDDFFDGLIRRVEGDR
jgi:hypothetical protein